MICKEDQLGVFFILQCQKIPSCMAIFNRQYLYACFFY